MRLAALFFFLLAPGNAFALEVGSPLWRALLHYSGQSSSAKPGAPFFLAPLGHEDPAAELAATQKYFDEHPGEAACRFPARALALGRVQEDDSELCQRWRKWREALSAKGIELVFAAAFINSPSSMYGHTLLKFPRSGKTEGEELLDYTLNYGADTGNTVGLAYVLAGLTGGFDGEYATAPFYLKVREYNYVENRDFWIYPLKVSGEELRLLVAHAWELRNVRFPYFFLHRNCSYYLLEFLEVARPGSELTRSFPLWAVPMDTIRRLGQAHWLGAPHYRASRYKKLGELRAQLSGAEASLALAASRSGEAGELPQGREALVLDSAYDLWRYGNESRREADPRAEGRLLAARAKVESSAFRPDFSGELPPEEGHPSSRLSLGGGVNRAHPFAELGFRGTLHDLLADPHGYEEGSELSMGDIRARVEGGKLYLERADILRLRSVSPRSSWFPKTSWSFRVYGERAKEFACAAWHCLMFGMEGGAGYSVRVGPALLFGLGEVAAEGGSVFDRGYRLAAGPTLGLLSPLWPGGRLLAEGEWKWRILGSRFMRHRLRLGISQSFSPLWEARALGEVNRGYREGMLAVMRYF